MRARPLTSVILCCIQWSKAVNNVETAEDGTVTVSFDDGSSYEGSFVAACDGGSSRIRTLLFPGHEKYHIPVRLMGVKLDCSPDEIEPLRNLDPFFLQGAASQNDSFVYFSGEPLLRPPPLVDDTPN